MTMTIEALLKQLENEVVVRDQVIRGYNEGFDQCMLEENYELSDTYHRLTEDMKRETDRLRTAITVIKERVT